ncbi:antitermination protein, partial [Citrobacter sp. TBCS-14]
ITWLSEYAKERAPFAIRRLAGKKFPLCMLILAKFAYNDYASSAADSYDCPACNGKCLVEKTST